MAQEITYAKWEEYLNGSLDEQEKASLESALQHDKDLKDQLALYQQVRAAQQDEQLIQFQTALSEAQQQFEGSSSTTNLSEMPKRRWLPLAALVAASLLFLLWLGYHSLVPAASPDQLYADYAQHEINLQEMSDDPQLGTIQALMQDQDYASALPLLETYLANHPDAADVQLAQAIALLESGKLPEATEALTRLQENHPIYANEARWYQALTDLKAGRISAARTALLSIPENSSRYESGQKLLQEIEKIK